MSLLSRSFFSVVPSGQSILTKSITNSASKYYFCSFGVLQKKNDSLTKSCSESTVVCDFPERPKKPATSFIRFAMDMKPTLIRDNPMMPKAEQMKYAGKLWNNADVDTRVKYQIEYYTELEKYYDALQKFNAGLTEEQSKALKKFEMRKKEGRVRHKIKERLKEFEKPKRPMNPFTFFIASKKDQLKKINAEVYCHEIAKEWNELPEKEKEKFRQLSIISRREYYQKMEEWKDRVGPLNIMHVLKTKNLDEAKKFLSENPVVDPPITLEEDQDGQEYNDASPSKVVKLPKMQFFNTVYLAVKHSRPLIQNYRTSVSNDVPNYVQRQSFKAFSTQSTDGRRNAPSDTPDKPQRPLNTYFRYFKLIEPKIVHEHPKVNRTEIHKIAKDMFKRLDKETLSGLEKQYSIEVEQYRTDMEAYKLKLANQQEAVLSSIPSKPKKPLSTFFRYINLIEPEVIQQHPNAKRTEIVKIAAEKFKTLSAESLLPLQNAYSNDMELYKKEMEAYTANLTDEQKKVLEQLKAVDKKNMQRRQLKKDFKEANKPKRPLNAYMLFAQKRRTEIGPVANVAEFTVKIGGEWKNLSEQERNKYVDESKKLLKKYETEISNWKASLENTEYAHLIEKPEKKSKSTKSKESTKSEESTKPKESTKSKSNLPKKTEERNSDSVSVENVIYSHCKADSKNDKSTISTVSSENDYNVQSCHSTSKNDETTISTVSTTNECYNVQSCHSTLNDKLPEIDSELKHTTNRYSINEIIVKLRKNDFSKIIFLIDSSVSDRNTVNVVIGVTFVSVFIVLPFFYFFC
ncbi:uncharacterized protein LOC135845191 [Planococcus citri]|uniref:uncharacterized protein LOC135845191 n=1 Tax=Planococcus citri TaxID=170843 RepID=UPI0031FA2A96